MTTFHPSKELVCFARLSDTGTDLKIPPEFVPLCVFNPTQAKERESEREIGRREALEPFNFTTLSMTVPALKTARALGGSSCIPPSFAGDSRVGAVG